jgi:metal-sulfur cluster biosynthetic enzyme
MRAAGTRQATFDGWPSEAPSRTTGTLVNQMTIDANLAKVDEVMTALYDIHDPEIGMSIVDLDLIKHVEIGADGAPTEIKMVLTTPFCPWAGELIQTVKQKTEEVVGPPVKVTLLADRWEPPPGLF